MKKFATSVQFEKLLNRMTPHISPESRLICAVFAQAWVDADSSSSRDFFLSPESAMPMYCALVGFDASQIRSIFQNQNTKYAEHLLCMEAV